MDYDAYLRSNWWQSFRAAYRASDKPQACLGCRNPLYQLHHITYERLGHERLDDVIPVCSDCHGKVHAYHRRTGTPLSEYRSAVKHVREKCRNRRGKPEEQKQREKRDRAEKCRDLLSKRWDPRSIALELNSSVAYVLNIKETRRAR